MTLQNIIGPGSERKKIKIFNSPADYFNSPEFIEDQRLKEEQEKKLNGKNTLEEKVEEREGYVFVPSLKLYVSKNTSMQGINWDRAQNILHKNNRRMPTIFEFIEFYKYLLSDEGRSKVKDSADLIRKFSELSSPWKAEWLDAKFMVFKGQLIMSHYAFDDGGSIIKKKINLGYYVEKSWDNVDLHDWVSYHTLEGFPNMFSDYGTLNYFFPKEGKVTQYYSDHEIRRLDCNSDFVANPPHPGVRFVER